MKWKNVVDCCKRFYHSAAVAGGLRLTNCLLDVVARPLLLCCQEVVALGLAAEVPLLMPEPHCSSWGCAAAVGAWYSPKTNFIILFIKH